MNARALALCLLGSIATLSAQEETKVGGETKTWVVCGRAVDERGEPIAAACLALLRRERVTAAAALAEPSARSDADGRFELTIAVPATPAESRVPVLAAPGRAMVLLRLGGVRWSGPDPQEIAPEPEKEGDRVVAARLEVRVQHEGHRPAEGRARFAMGDEFEFDSGVGVALAGRDAGGMT